MSQHIRTEISNAPVFAGLSHRALLRVDSLMTPVTFADGDVLCHETEIGRQAFLIVSGSAAVSRLDEFIADVGPGELVGELALLSGQRRNATVTAVGPVVALVMSSREFASILSLPGAAPAIHGVADQRADVAVGASAA